MQYIYLYISILFSYLFLVSLLQFAIKYFHPKSSVTANKEDVECGVQDISIVVSRKFEIASNFFILKFLLLFVITLIISYIVAMIYIKTAYWPKITFSQTWKYMPLTGISSFFIGISMTSLPFIGFSRYNYYNNRLQYDSFLNSICMYITGISSLFGHAIVSFPSSYYLKLHLFFVFLFLLSIIFFLTGYYILDSWTLNTLSSGDLWRFRIKFVNYHLCLLSFCIIFNTCCYTVMKNDFHNPIFNGIFSICEFILFLSYLITFLTYVSDFKNQIIGIYIRNA